MNPGVRESGSAESGSPGNAASGSLQVWDSWSLKCPESGSLGIRNPESGNLGPGIRESGSGNPESGNLGPESGSSESGSVNLGVPESGSPRLGVRESGSPQSGSPGSYSRPALSWAQRGPAQAQLKLLLSALSGARKLRPEIRCWDAPSDGFLEGKVASRNTCAPYSRPTLSWAQEGPVQTKFKTLLQVPSGSMSGEQFPNAIPHATPVKFLPQS